MFDKQQKMRTNPLDDISIESMFYDTKWVKLRNWISEQNGALSKQKIIKEMNNLETNEQFEKQNSTEICLSCGIHILSCNCEWSKYYFRKQSNSK